MRWTHSTAVSSLWQVSSSSAKSSAGYRVWDLRLRMGDLYRKSCAGEMPLGMDALVTVCSQNTNVIMVWAWMR